MSPLSDLIIPDGGDSSGGQQTPTLNGGARNGGAHYKAAQSISSRKFRDLENSIRGMAIFRLKVNACDNPSVNSQTINKEDALGQTLKQFQQTNSWNLSGDVSPVIETLEHTRIIGQAFPEDNLFEETKDNNVGDETLVLLGGTTRE